MNPSLPLLLSLLWNRLVRALRSEPVSLPTRKVRRRSSSGDRNSSSPRTMTFWEIAPRLVEMFFVYFGLISFLSPKVCPTPSTQTASSCVMLNRSRSLHREYPWAPMLRSRFGCDSAGKRLIDAHPRTSALCYHIGEREERKGKNAF